MGIPTTTCGDCATQEKSIYFYSMTGNTSFTSTLDPLDYAMKALDQLSVYKSGKNDDIVSVCTSKFGKTIRDDYHWNHVDEINQTLGIRGLFSQDSVASYRQHANRLKLLGL